MVARGGRRRDRRRGPAPAARRPELGAGPPPVHDRQGVRRRRARARIRRAACARASASSLHADGAAARPDAAGLPHRVRGRPHRRGRQAVRDLQRPLRAQGDRHRDGPGARGLAAPGQARDRDAALHRSPHRQGHVGAALLRPDAPRRARAARGVPAPHGGAHLPGRRGGRRRCDAHRIGHRRRPRRRHPRLDPPRRSGPARRHVRGAAAPAAARHPLPRPPRDRPHAPDPDPPRPNAATRSSAKRSTFATCSAPVARPYPRHA